LAGEVINFSILQINLRREHKFLFSGMLFGLCMARTVALTLRIVWASRPTNVRVAIAASIFTQAGVLILFLVNLIFAQRIMRAYHPHFGWLTPVNWVFRVLFMCVGALLIMVITATVDSFYTLNATTRRIDRDIQLFSGTFLAALAFAPIPIVIFSALLARPKRRVEKFGQGRFRTKIYLILFTSTLLALGAGFRIGVNFDVRPASNPAWYHSKPCYYCFNYVIEIICLYTYVIVRFDKRFHVPDGSKGPGDYAAVYGAKAASPAGAEPAKPGLHRQMSLAQSVASRVNDEEDVFGVTDGDADTFSGSGTEGEEQKERAWERRAQGEATKEDAGEAV
jgi:hypothetical protein